MSAVSCGSGCVQRGGTVLLNHTAVAARVSASLVQTQKDDGVGGYDVSTCSRDVGRQDGARAPSGDNGSVRLSGHGKKGS